VVKADGSAADVSTLLPLLREDADLQVTREGDLVVELVAEEHRFALEVGHGTMEIITDPCDDLHGIARIYETARGQLLRACDTMGFTVLGYGMQPLTPGSAALMSPKPRYRLLHEALGDGWLSFTQSASDQVHVAVGADEAASLTSLMNMLSPVVIALCANSPICAGAPTGFHSAREMLKAKLQPEHHRHGMPADPFDHISELVDAVCQMPYLIRREDNHVERMHGSFLDYLEDVGGAEAPGAWEQFLVHEHYVWHSARPRSAHGTIELRCAGQQPPEDHMVVAALTLGMVEAAEDLQELLGQRLGSSAWSAMARWHHAVSTRGIDAEEPVPHLLADVAHRIQQGLVKRQRGEERYLAPVFARIEQRTNPAKVALAAFEAGGIPALVSRLRVA